MFRRFLSVIAVFAVTLSSSAIRAAQPGVNTAKALGNMVCIEGKLPAYRLDDVGSVTLMLVKKDADLSTSDNFTEKVGYIDEIYPNFDGEYRLMFQFDGNISDYTLRAKLGGSDVTDSVISAAAFSDVIDVDIYDGSADGLVEFCTRTVNKYKCDRGYSVIFAVYDGDGRLFDSAVAGGSVTADEFERSFNTYLKKPKNMSAAKAFVFNNMTDIKPLTAGFAKGADTRLSPVKAKYFGGENYNVSLSYGFGRRVNDKNSEGKKQEGNPYGAYLTQSGGYIAFDSVDMTDMTAVQLYAGANVSSFRLGVYADEIADENKIGEYVINGTGNKDAAVYGSSVLSKMLVGRHTLIFKSEEEAKSAECLIKFVRLTDKADGREPPIVIDRGSENVTYTGDFAEENGSYALSSDGAEAQLVFSGTAVDINGVIGADCGYADVYIDGVFDKTLNLYNAKTLKRCIYTKANLSDGEHTVTVKKITGDKLYIDSFKVYRSPIRVVCIGDSITQGTGSTEQGEYSWPAQLQKLLGSGYVVFDNAMHGCTLASWQKGWMNESTSLLNADIIICAIGTNDYIGGRTTFNAETYKAAYTDFLKRAGGYSTVSPRIYVSKPPRLPSEDLKARAEVWKMFDEISAENNWPTVDFLAPLSGQSQNYTDGLHLNNRGYAIMAETAFSSLPAPEIMNKKRYDYALYNLDKRKADLSDLNIEK